MNTIERGDEKDRLPLPAMDKAEERPMPAPQNAKDARQDKSHTFWRVPEKGLPEPAAREWVRVDVAAWGKLVDHDQKVIARAIMALNQQDSAHYRAALEKADPQLYEDVTTNGVKWLKDNTDLMTKDAKTDKTMEPGAPAARDATPAHQPTEEAASTERANRNSAEIPQPESNSQDPASQHDFELPERLRKRYLIADNKYYFRDGERSIAFEDKGKRLATSQDDPEVAKSMVELAAAKNWQTIKIKGSTQFKSEVWLAASLRNMEVQGYRPTKLDKARLEELREPLSPAPLNEIEKGVDRDHDKASPTTYENMKPDQTSRGADDNIHTKRKVHESHTDRLSPQQRQSIDALRQILSSRGDSPSAVDMAANLAAQRFTEPRVYLGKVVAHGYAPFQHDKDNDPSYYIVLDTKQGERTVWGVDLSRALLKGNADVGDEIVLAYQGKKPVTVQTRERDASGKPTGKFIEIAADRNAWDVSKVDILRDAAINRIKKDATWADKLRRLEPQINVYDPEAPSQRHARPAEKGEKAKAREPKHAPSR